MRHWVKAQFAGKLAHNTLWMLAGQGVCLLIQAAYFIIIARGLGPKQYGTFIAVIAASQILAPFVGFGGSNLLIKNVARDVNEFPVCWGNLLFLTIGSGLCATGVVVAAARLVLPLTIPEIVIISVCLAELLCSRLTDCSAMAFQAIESLDRTAQLTIGIALARLIGIAGLAAIVRYPSIQNWAIVYLSTSILAATLGVIWVNNTIGQPRLELRRVKGELSEGFYFAASLSAQNIYNDIDKSMLARMA